MKYKKGSFITIPNRDSLRGKDALLQTVFTWICSYADESGVCFPSRKKLATDCGASTDSIDRKIKVLIEMGLLEKEVRKDGKKNKTNLYQIMLKEEGGSRTHAARVAAQTTLGVAAPDPQGTKPNKNSIQLTTSGVPPQDVAEVIDSFKVINPVAKNWFKNTTQRAASEQLIEIMGTKEKVINFVSRVLPGINSRKYAPRSTTPHELLNNLAKIKSFVEQEKEKKVGIIL